MNSATDLLYPWRIRVCKPPAFTAPELDIQINDEMPRHDSRPLGVEGVSVYGYRTRSKRDRDLHLI